MIKKCVFVLVAIGFLFSSCKRELVFNGRIQGNEKINENRLETHGFKLVNVASGMTCEDPKRGVGMLEKADKMKEEAREVSLAEVNSNVRSNKAERSRKNEIKKNIRKELKATKEMDPRLVRGLWMTIFGGIAVTLGIVFSSLAPTGLFVFAFGIVFLVGLITLLMYLANPKPKM